MPARNLVFLPLSEAANSAENLRVGRTAGNKNYYGRYIMNLPSVAICVPSHRFALSVTLLLLAASAHAIPPILTPISGQSVREGANLSIPLSATDPDGGTITFSATGMPGFCSLTDSNDGTGSIDCSPGAGDAGNSNITVTATDSALETASDNFVLTVEANTAPNIGNIINRSMAEGTSLNIPVSASDNDGDGVSFSESGLPGFCSLTDNNDNTADIDCNPGAGGAGVYPVTITATDDAPIPLGDSELFTLTVSANSAPVITAINNQSVAEGATLDIPLSASDSPGDSLAFSETGLPGFCALTDNGNGTGNIECNPGAGDSGTYTPITITVTDDAPVPGSDSDSFSLTVTSNTAPILAPIADQGVAEGASLNISLSATDPNGDGLAFSQSGLPGFCSLTDNGNGTGNIACSPGGGDGGSYPITITVTDNAPIPLNDSDPFTLTVSTNTPPVLTPIANQSVEEGETLNVPLNATDGDGDGLSFSQTGLPGFCSLTDNGNGTGSIACNPGGGDGGTYPITVTVTDDAPVPASDSDPFTLTVSANNPPVLTGIPDQSVVEGGSISIGLNATEPDGDGMSLSQTGMPGFCSLTDNGNGIGTIDCNPVVGDAGAYPIIVTVTDDGPVPAQASDNFVLTVDANQPPTASGVSITGDPTVGSQLTGNYTYADAEDDPEGSSTFRWLRNGTAISGATAQTYTVVVADVETSLRFEVTPVATTGATTGTPVQSGDLQISNTAPSITGQNRIQVVEDTSREIVLGDLIVSDLDSDYPDDFTLAVQDGANYSRVGSTITPAQDFNGDLTVPVTVNDGFVDSPVFNLVVTVTPVNDAPSITGVVAPLSTPEDTPRTILVEELVITDPDNAFPADFTLVLQDGANYERSGIDGNTIVPAENFNGTLSIPATVSDLEPLTSVVFNITLTVSAENDTPTPDLPIDPQTAIENTPFLLDVSGNFSDADGDALAFSTIGLPPSLEIDPVTGVISGTPRFEDARDNEPYVVVVTAQDPVGAFATAEFDLTVSALDRANLALLIDVSSEAASPTEDLRWTFSAINPIGPQPGQDVELTGRFVGAGISVSAEPGTSCTIDPAEGAVTQFMCTLGALPIGGTLSVVLTTSITQATEIVVFATAAGAQNLPIDPNIEDNSAFEAAGVADSFSNGAVQFLGVATIRSMAAGDLNGDGLTDIVAGTAAGQPVQLFLGDLPRESCDCPRDFLATPLSIANNGAQEGVALADFDRNGSLDVVVANDGGLADVVFLNDGAGNFGTLPSFVLTATFAKDVAVGDFNGDANPDIVIAAVGGNPVFLGDGTGAFTLETTLGTANSSEVAVADLDGNGLDDVVVANIGTPSQVWLRSGGGGFVAGSPLAIGDATSVLAADLNGSGGPDLVFGRVPADDNDVPSNPVLLNDGTGTFGAASDLLGLSPTNDVLVGETNGDGLPDLVFVNASGVHQIWTAGAGGYSLHREQIIDGDAQSGLLTDLGFTDNGNPGGHDLAIGGAGAGGLGVYLNDGDGNLGRGDAVPPVLTLLGEPALEIDSGGAYRDAGATALDNIDGDVSGSITVTGAVNTAVVGSYTLTYNVSDFAGNAATAVTRTVTVAPAAGTGGGGGGAISIGVLNALAALVIFLHFHGIRARRNARVIIKITRDDPDE